MALWSSVPPPPAPAPPASDAASRGVSANNALFLIGGRKNDKKIDSSHRISDEPEKADASYVCVYANAFCSTAVFGMFLVVSVLPALVAAVVKLVALLTVALVLAAATNPSDHSFACWVSSQENIRMKESPSVSQWFSAVYKTAMAIVRNESLTWNAYNVIVFTVVFVPSIERYAFGCFGSWRWADTNSYVSDLCRAPWVVKFARGGVVSSIERYLDHPATPSSSRSNGYPGSSSSSSSSGGVRRRHSPAGVPSSVPSAFADVLQATGLMGVSSARTAADSDLSDRELRTRAMQLKIKKEWKEAARYFMDAASAALSTLSKTSYRLEAAWCILEDSDKYPSKKTQLIKMVEEVCEELASGGYFDEASRAFAELALRLKRKFPHDCHREDFAKDIALLFVRAKNIAEAGGSVRGAVENGLRAAAVYAEVGMWALAEECFESAGEMQLTDGNAALATEAFGNAVLCRIGQLDMIGAEEMVAKHARLIDGSHGLSDIDVLLASVLKAYSKCSLQIFETARKRYDSIRRLAPWQNDNPHHLREEDELAHSHSESEREASKARIVHASVCVSEEPSSQPPQAMWTSSATSAASTLMRSSNRNALSNARSTRRHLATATSPFHREEYGLFIDGKQVPSSVAGSRMSVENPATTKPLAWIAEATKEDVELAVASGRAAFENGVWSRASTTDRSRVLHDIAAALRARIPEFAEKESLQTGRPIREMRAQLTRIPEWFEYFAALIRTSEGTVPPFSGSYVNYVQRVPLGVVGQITPWNHPLLIAVKKIAPALAAGNSVVVKPSELAPITVVELAELCHNAGLPAGVLNCVPGLGGVAGAALVSNPSIKKIDFTGGTTTGRAVAAAAGQNLASSTMELGGKAPLVIFDDVDIDEVVNGAAFACFIASGQTCVTGARLIVHEKIIDEFVDRLVAKVSTIRLGDPMSDSTQMGTVISKEHLLRIHGMVERAKAQGATIRCGGKRAEGLKGYFYEPTVISNVTPDMEIVKEEVFGPVVSAYAFKDEAEAIKLANDSQYGLGAAIWTTNIKRAHRVAHNLDAGIIWLNDHHRNDPSSPWGGMKNSGIGRENGLEALKAYSQGKSVVVGFGDERFDWFVNEKVRYG